VCSHGLAVAGYQDDSSVAVGCAMHTGPTQNLPDIVLSSKFERINVNKTRCRLQGSFASAWPELIIACDVRERSLLQTDRQKDRHHNRITLRLPPL